MTAPTVKKFEFHKSKMADGRHFKNRYIILSQQPFLLIFIKFGTVIHVGPQRLAQSSNFKFSTILYGRSPLSSESKNCLNILCNYTMTHYTILTVKQQILILKTTVYP